jgi:steroid delta-isomerase-like uncharacterized protein
MTADLAAYAGIINRACNSHDTERLLSLYSPDCVGSDVSQADLLRGHAGLRTLLEMYWGAFPDLRFVVTNMIVQDPSIAIVWVAEGTHQGPIMNIPPTGRRIQVKGMSVIEVADGLVVRGEHIWDLAGMLRHMGLLPEL